MYLAGANLADVERARRDILDAELKIMVEQQLALRTAASGVRAFFLEMQEQAKSTGQILYESLNNGLNRFSASLTKAITGQKPQWEKMFKSIGSEMLEKSIRSGAQLGLGKLGDLIPGVKEAKDKAKKAAELDKGWGKSETQAWWVRWAGSAPGSAGGGNGTGPLNPTILQGNGGLLGTGSVPRYSSGIAGILQEIGGLFGGGGGGSTPSVTSSVSFPGFATGGDASPGQSFLAGEAGPELIRTRAGAHISNAAQTRSLMRGGDTHVYSIDARGTDPYLTGQRVELAIKAAREDAVSTSIQAQHQHGARTPRKSAA